MKKKMYLIVWTLFTLNIAAQKHFYISNSGNDNNNGLSEQTAWRTLQKIEKESTNFQPGDIISLRGGDEFYGKLYLKGINGLHGNPIVFKSYGTGQAKIKGSESITNWTNKGSNIWSATVGTDVYQVFKNDVRLINARSKYYTITTDNSSNSFTSKELIGRGDISKASILFTTTEWLYQIAHVSNFNSGNGRVTLKTSPSKGFNVGTKFIVLNDINELGSKNDWHYDVAEKKLYIYSTMEPKDITVTKNAKRGVEIVCNHLDFKNIEVTQFGGIGIYLNGSNINIDNVTVKDNFEKTIVNYNSGYNISVTNSNLSGSKSGMSLAASNSEIEYNTIYNIGTQEVLSYKGVTNGSGIGVSGDNSSIKYNILHNLGYNGIVPSGKHTMVKYNYIYDFNNFLEDGAAIYTHTGSNGGTWLASRAAFSEIEYNTIIGSQELKERHAFGIYLDDCSTDVTIKYNNVSETSSGIYLHNNKRCEVSSNNLYKNKQGIVIREEPNGDNSGGLNENDGEMVNNIVNFNNIYLIDNSYSSSAVTLHSHYGNKNLYKGDNNILFNYGSRNPIRVLMGSVNSGRVDQMDLENYQKFTIQESRSIQNDSIKQFYAISSYLSDNLLTNGDFMNGTKTWSIKNGTLSISGNNLLVKPSNDKAQLIQAYDKIKFVSDNYYEIEFKAKSNKKHSIGYFFQEMSPPYSNTGVNYNVHLQESWSTHKFLIKPNFTGSNVRFSLHETTNIGFEIKDVKIRKVNVGDKPGYSFFAKNNKNKLKPISIPNGNWICIRTGKIYSGSVNLEPFTSLILISSESNSVGVFANAGTDVEICKGESITLKATGGSIYKWSTGETTQNITIRPDETTTYTVIVSEGGESDTDDVVVTVNETIANAGADKTITEGESLLLTATGGDSYVWSTGETSETIVVSPTTNLTYTLKAITGSCEDTDEVKITVRPSAGGRAVVANAGQDQSICNGENVTLTASGGSSYLWSTGATSKSITVSPMDTTIYSVTVSEESDTDTDEVTVEVNNVVVNAGTDRTMIEGESITLVATGGDSYVWNTGEESNTITVNPSSTRIYSVTAYLGSCSDTDDVKVTVEPKTDLDSSQPNVDAGEDMTICLGATIVLSGSGGETYSWSTGETTNSISVSPQRTVTYELSATRGGVTNNDFVTITVENCNSISQGSGVQIATEEDITILEMSVYPNPTDGELNVRIDNIESELNLIINDAKGSILHHEVLTGQKTAMEKDFDLSRYTSGLYFVHLFNAELSLTKKLIVQ